ncbi:MAG: S8 family serine peptidase, partial [Planctomycetota bacterium]
GPDGALYVSIGDGTSYNQVDPRTFRVQDIDNLSGKVLRIDPLTGAGLAGNPYFQSNNPFSNRSKVYQRGLRNPFRISVHPQTGEVFIADVGWGQWEEVNRAGAGANFGWPYYEGGSGASLPTVGYRDRPESQAFYQSGQSTTPAIVALNHAADGINAIVGGDVYTGTAFPAQYQGDYFFNDLGGGIVRTVSFDSNGNVTSVDTFTTGAQFVVQMKQGPDGNLYFVNLVTGTVGRWTFAPAASLAGFEAPAAPWGESFSATSATGQGVTIALIDTGLDHTHPDLANVRWENPGEVAWDGIDNDGNGLIDDRFGYDFVDGDANLADGNGHGTGMASVIAAVGNQGIVGNAPGAAIMMLRAVGDNGLGVAEDVATAIRYAVDQGADIINIPLVVEDVQSVRDAVAYAESNDVLIVAAAGNSSNSQPAFPANLGQQYNNVLSVGALSPDGMVLPESNGNDGIGPMVYALGVAAVSQPGGGKSVFRGTSVASSMVASAAAIAMELNPDLSSSQLRQLLLASSNFNSGSGENIARLSIDEVVDRATRSNQFRFVTNGTAWIVHGTDGDESYQVSIESPLLAIDGISYEIPVGLDRITIQSKNGNDTLGLVGTDQADIITAADGFVRLVASSLRVRGNDFSNVKVEGGAGVDIVRMQGSPNDDWFGVEEGRTAMRIGLDGVVATNVEKVRINAGLGEDTAFIQGTTGNDQIITRPLKARLR